MKQGRTRLEMEKHIEEARSKFDMKKAKKFLYQAHQKLGEAVFVIDSKANPNIVNKIFDLQKQIEGLQQIVNWDGF
jgi:hypothetical protein